jgi:hypothetical protein
MASASARIARRAGFATLGLACLQVLGGGLSLASDPGHTRSPHSESAADVARAAATATSSGVTNDVRLASVKGLRGTAKVCTAPGKGCKPLTAARSVRIGRYIDASQGAVSLQTRRADGTPSRMIVSRGLFRLEQAVATDAVLVARMAGGGFRSACGSDPATAPATPPGAAAQRFRRQLQAGGEGAFRIAGAYASVTTASATFQVIDRCGSTLTAVAAGTVEVAQPAAAVRRTVTAPDSYLAAAPVAPRAPAGAGTPGVSNAVHPVSVPGFPGPTKVCTGPGTGCRILSDDTVIPIGSYIDTRKGAISLTTRLADGSPGQMLTYGVLFELRQAKSPGAVLESRIVGGNFVGICGRKGPAPISASLRDLVLRAKGKKHGSKKTVSSQHNDGHGKFRSLGGWVGATVEGTRFELRNRCDGSLVVVSRGTVKVFDRTRTRYVRVSAPNSYLAKAPGG